MNSPASTKWMPLATAPNTVVAEVLAGRLRVEGVPVDVRTDTALLGEARLCRMYVPAKLLHRARSILDADVVSDEELTFLATGERPSEK